MQLKPLVTWLDKLLRTPEIEDFPNALNGLQVENSGRIERVAAAVDAAESVLERAAALGPRTLLVVHHGLFWSGNQTVTGPAYRKLKLAIDADLAVYSSHLPLDLHSTLGNNALLASALGLKPQRPFAKVGLGCGASVTRRALTDKLEEAVGRPVHLAPGGPEKIRKVAVLTGGGGSYVNEAAAEGYDTLITGEGAHHTFAAAEELGVNLFYAGHYATETFGVKALCEAIQASHGLPWEFIDYPSGL